MLKSARHHKVWYDAQLPFEYTGKSTEMRKEKIPISISISGERVGLGWFCLGFIGQDGQWVSGLWIVGVMSYQKIFGLNNVNCHKVEKSSG